MSFIDLWLYFKEHSVDFVGFVAAGHIVTWDTQIMQSTSDILKIKFTEIYLKKTKRHGEDDAINHTLASPFGCKQRIK